jgi:hypothetical protein
MVCARSGSPCLARLLAGAPVADVVDPAEDGDDLLVVRDDDDRSSEPPRHLVQIAHHGQRPLAVERRRGFVGKDDRRLVYQPDEAALFQLLWQGRARTLVVERADDPEIIVVQS